MRIFGDGCQLGLGRSIIRNGRNWIGRKNLVLLSGLPTSNKACYPFGGLVENCMDSETDVCLGGWLGYEDRDSIGFLAGELFHPFASL